MLLLDEFRFMDASAGDVRASEARTRTAVKRARWFIGEPPWLFMLSRPVAGQVSFYNHRSPLASLARQTPAARLREQRHGSDDEGSRHRVVEERLAPPAPAS